jgi:PAS domain S-box-containing protein
MRVYFGIMSIFLVEYPLLWGKISTDRISMKNNLSKTHFRSIINEALWESSSHMFISGTDGTILDVNNAYLKSYGFKRQEVIGKKAMELGHVSNEVIRKVLKQIKKTGRAENVLFKVKNKKNEVRHMIVSTIPVVLNKKALFLSVGTDVSNSVPNFKNRHGDILKLFDSFETVGISLISDYGTKHASLFYANKKATNILKKYPLNDLLNKLKIQDLVNILFDSKSHFVRKVGKPNGSHMQLIIMYNILDNIHVEKAFKHYNFTPRQQEILLLAVKGLSNNEIAEKLFISEFTVKDHLKNIFQIADVHTRSELFPKILDLR